MTLLGAMARQEGFYAQGTRPQRNNNPGDIEWGKFAKAHGAVKGDPRFAIFPSIEAGFGAMRALLQTGGYKGLTVHEALNRWAPPIENDTSAYEKNVCAWSGCKPTDIIDDLLQIPITPGKENR